MRCLTDKISDGSMGVLLVSHSLKEIKGICDHCFLMKDQTIVAQQDLLENHLFRVQLVFLQEREPDFKTLLERRCARRGTGDPRCDCRAVPGIG